jgi:hypothetical protein
MRVLHVIFGLVSLLAVPLRAQDASVGASYTLLSLTYPDQIPNGFGGWLAWRFIDLGANLFPEDHPIIGRQTQLFVGARTGVQFGGFGAYARARPGLVHFGRRFMAPEIACVAVFPPPEACLIHATNFALDVGATVEFSPTPHAVFRIDTGDTVIRFSRTALDPVWRHNLQVSAGGGLRF